MVEHCNTYTHIPYNIPHHHRGRQVFFYKRAQIFVGDVWGAFAGQGLGRFDDIHSVTMFADYRVPVVLRQHGVLQYSDALAQMVCCFGVFWCVLLGFLVCFDVSSSYWWLCC